VHGIWIFLFIPVLLKFLIVRKSVRTVDWHLNKDPFNAICQGLGKRDAGCIEHMMVYDKQLKDFTTVYDEEAIIREGDEDPPPHSYT